MGSDWLSASLRSRLDAVLLGLQRRVLGGSAACTSLCLEMLRDVLVASRFRTPAQLRRAIRSVAAELIGAAPHELCIGNVVRRVLFIVREDVARISADMHDLGSGEHSRHNSVEDEVVDRLENIEFEDSPEGRAVEVAPSLLGSFMPANAGSADAPADFDAKKMSALKQAVVHSINELYEELDNLYAPICEQSPEHIHADECVLVVGYSAFVEHFLRFAAKKRRFFVIVAEGGCLLDGHRLASALRKVPNIAVTLIPDANVYPVMGRVSKVILSPCAVLADGGLIASAGTEAVCIAAKDCSVPVLCLASTFMLSPVFAHNHGAVLHKLLSPALVMDYDSSVNSDGTEAVVAAYDYVPPHFVDTIITNAGTHQPSYMHRLLGEFYHAADYDLNLGELAVAIDAG